MRVWTLISAVIVAATAQLARARDDSASKHSIYGGFALSEGGPALSADYEYLGMREFGIGGYVRIYPKDDDGPGVTKAGVTTFGGYIRPHFNKKSWDLYVAPGVGIISIDSLGANPGDATTLGPSLAIGLMYDLNGSVALGVDNFRTWVWFEKDWRTQMVDDFMIRFRVSF